MSGTNLSLAASSRHQVYATAAAAVTSAGSQLTVLDALSGHPGQYAQVFATRPSATTRSPASVRLLAFTCAGGEERKDQRMSLGTALTYKFNREFSLKGEYRYDQLRSNAVGVNYNASIFLIGLKLQR